jgi:hypothetical protein
MGQSLIAWESSKKKKKKEVKIELLQDLRTY